MGNKDLPVFPWSSSFHVKKPPFFLLSSFGVIFLLVHVRLPLPSLLWKEAGGLKVSE